MQMFRNLSSTKNSFWSDIIWLLGLTLASLLVSAAVSVLLPLPFWLQILQGSILGWLMPALIFNASRRYGFRINTPVSLFPFYWVVIVVIIGFGIDWILDSLLDTIHYDWVEKIRAWSESQEQMLGYLLTETWNLKEFWKPLLVICISPAVCEELFYRAVLTQIGHRAGHSAGQVIIGSAFVFAIAHLSLVGLSTRFALGVLLGYIYYRKGRVTLPIIIHSVYNFFVVLLTIYLPTLV